MRVEKPITAQDFAEDTEGTVRREFTFLGLQADVPLHDLKTIRPEVGRANACGSGREQQDLFNYML